jgi:uncharacterized protein YPO0396
MTAPARTPESIINAKIADRRAAAQREIAELRASISDPEANPGWLNTFAGGLQREVAFLNALEEIEFSFADIDDRTLDPQVALVKKMLVLVNMTANIAETSGVSKDIVQGRVAAAKGIARIVGDISHDLAKGVEL